MPQLRPVPPTPEQLSSVPFIAELLNKEELQRISTDHNIRESMILSEGGFDIFWVTRSDPAGCILSNEKGSFTLNTSQLRLGQKVRLRNVVVPTPEKVKPNVVKLGKKKRK